DVSAQVRDTLREHKVCLINVMGSPGAGKTSLLTALIARLREEFAIGVIEGDITGQIDAEKIAALNIPAVQLNTDGACHIEAMSIQHILPQFDLDGLRSEEHTSELQSRFDLVCRLLLEKNKCKG